MDKQTTFIVILISYVPIIVLGYFLYSQPINKQETNDLPCKQVHNIKSVHNIVLECAKVKKS